MERGGDKVGVSSTALETQGNTDAIWRGAALQDAIDLNGES